MRDRKEIEEAYNEIKDPHDKVGDLALEILLDIRELLWKK